VPLAVRLNMDIYNFGKSGQARALQAGPSGSAKSKLKPEFSGESVIGQAGVCFDSANGILRKFPAGLLNKLQSVSQRVAFKGGEYLYSPDEEIEWIYFPETTIISELQILEDGRTIEVSLTGNEGAVGVTSVFKPSRSLNWVQVCTPGTAVKVKRQQLRNETRDLDLVNMLFYGAIQEYVAQLSQKAACNAHHSVEERFPTWLLMLQNRCDVNHLKLTQEQIARALGVYRPTITYIAHDMRDQGLIDYVRGTVVIRDIDGLKKRSCGCYSNPAAKNSDLNFTRNENNRIY